MKNTRHKKSQIFILALIFIFVTAIVSNSQTTSFSYQGSLQINSQPANGNFDFEFRLFNAFGGGTQQGTVASANNIAVTNGSFSTILDFGTQFPGANRFLEISVRAAGGGGFTLLSPRQQIVSSPYSVKSLSADNAATATNAFQLGGVPSIQFVLTTDPRMTNARTPTTGSVDYIQNSTTTQSNSNFRISGTGRANIFDSDQFNLQGRKFLTANLVNNNMSLGFGSGSSLSDPSSVGNTFLGSFAGQDHVRNFYNTYVGSSAGKLNQIGGSNTFVGALAGVVNKSGANSFVGTSSGGKTETGANNTFFGVQAGLENVTGNNNTIIGSGADVSSDDLTYATALGSESVVSTNNTVKLGRVADQVIAPGAMIVGNSTTQRGNLSVYSNSGNADLYLKASPGSVGINLGVGSVASGNPFFFISHYDGVTYSDRFAITPSGFVQVNLLGSAGSQSVCRNAGNELSTCSSSKQYKSNIENFSPGLELIKRLRPVSFDWKSDFTSDLGLVAEEVAEVEPLLTTTNEKGEVEGVKYDRVGVVLVNAVNEQQTQIESIRKADSSRQTEIELLQKEIVELKSQIRELAKLKQAVCLIDRTLKICEPSEGNYEKNN